MIHISDMLCVLTVHNTSKKDTIKIVSYINKFTINKNSFEIQNADMFKGQKLLPELYVNVNT